MRLMRWLGGALLLALVGLAVAWQQWQAYLDRPMDLQAPLVFEVAPGSSLASTVHDLARRDALQWPQGTLLYGRWEGLAARIKAGEYQLEPGTTPRQLLAMLVAGSVQQHTITFVEGWNFAELRAELARHDRLQQKTEGLSDSEVMAQLGYPDQHPEGRFFPDTYQYHKGISDLVILEQAYQRMQQVLSEAWSARAENVPYETPYEALIMASIVEKETGVPSERGQIAGVFVRRLQQGMRLQTDPTVIYGLGEAYAGNLTRRHLRQRTPYNTYRVDGLPPTPIAMPGAEAIHAALNPAAGDTLYFVAKGDGSHYFSSTLKQHTRAVRRYQMASRKKDYRSSPAQE